MTRRPTPAYRFLPFAALLFFAPGLAAQGMDPSKEIKEIAERIEKQLEEIDRLLLESSDTQKKRARPRDLLEQTVNRSNEVVEGVEELIEKLQDLKNQSDNNSSSSSDSKPRDDQKQPQPGQQQNGKQQRNENDTPTFEQQPKPGEQQGEQQQGEPKPGEQKPGEQQQPGEQKPTGGQEANTEGENRKGKGPREDETGPGNPGEGEEGWGNLPSYLNPLKNRGSPPKVPAKYRKYWEAWLKKKRKEGK